MSSGTLFRFCKLFSAGRAFLLAILHKDSAVCRGHPLLCQQLPCLCQKLLEGLQQLVSGGLHVVEHPSAELGDLPLEFRLMDQVMQGVGVLLVVVELLRHPELVELHPSGHLGVGFGRLPHGLEDHAL